MKANSILEAFSKIDGTLQIEADTAAETKPQAFRRLRFAAIAATFAIIVLLIPIVVILANRTAQPPIPPIPSTSTSTPPSTTPKEHLSITDIPGAIRVDTTQLDYETETIYNKLKLLEFIRETREDRYGFLGTVISSESVMIKHLNYNLYLHLTVLNIKVNESICNAEQFDTVKVAYACWYTSTNTPLETCYCIREDVSDQSVKAQKEPYAFYVIDEADNDRYVGYRIHLGDDTYLYLKDYADYRLIMHLSYDGKYVSYFGDAKWDIEYFRSGFPEDDE